MSKGYLIINVYLEDVGMPIEGATVRIEGEGFKGSFITDNNGKTTKIELPAPDIKYSLTPQQEVRPYSLYNLTVTKSGLPTTIIKNVEVLPEETSFQNVFIKKNRDTLIELPEHLLWSGSEPKIIEDPIKEEIQLFRVLPRVIIPEYITVHDGAPTETATNYVVPFIDYIKNVTSSEIYSTWHIEAIKANVHAIVSFTLNRIFTEWYLARGFNFTITSSPAYDQAYVHNRTIFQTISNVVDEYFRYYIKLNGVTQPLLAQYRAGPTGVPSGILNQWGSQDLALAGKTAIEIVKYYYTTNLTLPVAEEMIGLPISFPGYNIKVGSCGQYVQKVQVELNRIRGNYPGIPAISPADGQYGQSTKAAVEVFQRAFDLPVNGIVDFATWFKISYVFGAVAQLSAGV